MPNRTILVTGGAGHVGSHLIELLLTNPANRVVSLDNYSNGSPSNHIPGCDYRRGHTKNIDRLIPETPDLLFHLGEYARISTSFEDVDTVFDFNLAGTFAVAEFCRRRGVGKLVYSASSTKFAIEGDGRSQSPYGWSKAANVDLINGFGRWYGLPYAICYFYNAFGPREVGSGKYATVMAKFETLYAAGQPLPVTKPGTQKRAFTYVKDLAAGIALVGEKGHGDGYALGATTSYSILEIARAFGGPIVMVDGDPGRAESSNDADKARHELGWNTTVDVIDYIAAFRQRVASSPAGLEPSP
ncbi:MAG TPA: NAD-dependent epimerase/dehydratase family protein [Gemmatimonadaceae bacterium]|nr:NAD-dependent epimerase/dehydratase family protein [Gemmatimonadaceae bacterium]